MIKNGPIDPSSRPAGHYERQIMTRPKLKSFSIQREWCKGCGICVVFCPTEVLELDSQGKVTAVRLEACIACEMCALRCPDLAITLETTEKEEKP